MRYRDLDRAARLPPMRQTPAAATASSLPALRCREQPESEGLSCLWRTSTPRLAPADTAWFGPGHRSHPGSDRCSPDPPRPEQFPALIGREYRPGGRQRGAAPGRSAHPYTIVDAIHHADPIEHADDYAHSQPHAFADHYSYTHRYANADTHRNPDGNAFPGVAHVDAKAQADTDGNPLACANGRATNPDGTRE
jgi:hypothetical protein